MTSFALIFGLAAMFNLINKKWLKLPMTIALMIMSLAFVGLTFALKPITPGLFDAIYSMVHEADFERLLFDGMLSFLLFAGALHINIKALAKERWSVLLFATLGVLISTILIGFSMHYLAMAISVDLPLIYALLFGALISPTDPIAVIAILTDAKVAQSLQLKIEGESLFNDGVGVVVFSGIALFLPMTEMHGDSISASIGMLFLEEVVGGFVFGAALGFIGYKLMRSTWADPKLTLILSIAVVMTGYAIAGLMHFSGPLAMVVCGLVIGNAIHINDGERTPTHNLLNEVWEVLDEMLNGVLFVLIGLAIHLFTFETSYMILGAIAIVIVLFSRFVSIKALYGFLNPKETSPADTVKILTWGGLRGGISIALALSLGDSVHATGIQLMTYVVVVFAILVQGMTLGPYVRHLKIAERYAAIKKSNE